MSNGNLPEQIVFRIRRFAPGRDEEPVWKDYPIAYEAGMMTTVETRVRWVGKRGYHMEDLIEITDGAPVVRSDYFDNEEILVVEP